MYEWTNAPKAPVPMDNYGGALAQTYCIIHVFTHPDDTVLHIRLKGDLKSCHEYDMKGQMVVPRSIKTRMGLKHGDKIRYSVKGSKIEIEKLSDTESFDTFVAFTEWSSDADEEAYKHLQT